MGSESREIHNENRHNFTLHKLLLGQSIKRNWMGSDCGSYKYPLFSLLSFLSERKYTYEITTLFVHVFCAPSKISTFEMKTNFHEIWCAHYATRGYPNIICCNFLQLVITHINLQDWTNNSDTSSRS
jgi:hypothetical protein